MSIHYSSFFYNLAASENLEKKSLNMSFCIPKLNDELCHESVLLQFHDLGQPREKDQYCPTNKVPLTIPGEKQEDCRPFDM